MRLTSPDFDEGGIIPAARTRLGAETSPPLVFADVPPWAQELVLIVEDPDAPHRPFIHWLLHRVPPRAGGLPTSVVRAAHLPDGSRQGRNDYGTLGWGGPCPPPGPAHRYVFTLRAVDAPLGLPPHATAADLHAALVGRRSERATLVGLFGVDGATKGIGTGGDSR